MEMLQGVWKQHLRPRAVVGYGVKIYLPSPPNYVTRSPGTYITTLSYSYGAFLRESEKTSSLHCNFPRYRKHAAISSCCGISLSSEVDSSATREPCMLLTRAPRSMVGNVSDEILA